MDTLEHLAATLGPRNCLTSADDVAPYAVDWRGAYRGTPRAVLKPSSTEEVAAVVREAGCGLLLDSGDPAAIAAAVAGLADPARRAALGEAGWRAAGGRFAWEGEAARLVALYRDLAPLP